MLHLITRPCVIEVATSFYPCLSLPGAEYVVDGTGNVPRANTSAFHPAQSLRMRTVYVVLYFLVSLYVSCS